MTILNDKAVGDIIKIKENGVAVNYIIIHKGLPSDMYDASCDGVWLLREQAHSQMTWKTETIAMNDYENSNINVWLNNTFLNTISEEVRTEIKTVKIPFKKGLGNASTSVQSGVNGLSCKVFLLSGYEVGFTTADNQYFPIDGARLSYFLNGNSDVSARTKRICAYNNNYQLWWFRSPCIDNDSYAWTANSEGYHKEIHTTWRPVVRPALILPPSLLIGDDGTLLPNTPPTITSDKIGDLGTLTNGFTCNYSVDDADTDDNVTVTLSMDSTAVKTFTATKNQQETYSLTGNDWLKITNGEHTFAIAASDGKDTTTSTATFTRNCNKLTVTLAEPLVADARISACSLAVDGFFPTDAIVTYEVTNNANDDTPVWEDCSAKVKAGFSYMFKNKTAANGFAFNFRITAERGASKTGGYITKITGGYQ